MIWETITVAEWKMYRKLGRRYNDILVKIEKRGLDCKALSVFLLSKINCTNCVVVHYGEIRRCLGS
jgi:hypothetical protein